MLSVKIMVTGRAIHMQSVRNVTKILPYLQICCFSSVYFLYLNPSTGYNLALILTGYRSRDSFQIVELMGCPSKMTPP